MLKYLAFAAGVLVATAALADPLRDAQAVCKSYLAGQNTINRVGQAPVTWPAYNRPECDALEALTNKNVPPDPTRQLDEKAVIGAAMALATGIHPVALNPVSRAACVAQGYANIAVELAQSAGDAASQSAMAAASADAGKACAW